MSLDEIKDFRGAYDKPDERDFIAEHLFGADVLPIPDKVNLNNVPSHNQGKSWHCTSYALTHCEEILNTIEFNLTAQADPEEQWKNQFEDRGSPAYMEKEGDSLQHALQVMVKFGVHNKNPNIPIDKYTITGFAKVKDTIVDCENWLAKDMPLYTGAGNHCFAIVGYDKIKKVFIAKNSYGNDWGKRKDGTWDIAYADFGKLFTKYIVFDKKDLIMIFRDVSEQSPMAKNIKRMLELNLMKGYGDQPNAVDRLFMPEKPVSRAELAEVLGNFIDKFNLK